MSGKQFHFQIQLQRMLISLALDTGTPRKSKQPKQTFIIVETSEVRKTLSLEQDSPIKKICQRNNIIMI